MTISDLPQVNGLGARGLADHRDLGRVLLYERSGIHATNNSVPLRNVNSTPLVPLSSRLLSNAPMDVYDIRRLNLIGMVDAQFEGRLARLARSAEVSESYLSQIKTRKRAMGRDFAGKLEDALGKPDGWMDQPQYSMENAVLVQEMLQIMDGLSAEDREALMKHARLLNQNTSRGAHNPFGPKGKP